MKGTLVLLLVLAVPACLAQILEWQCQCFKTKQDCTENNNGIPFADLEVDLADKSCRQANLTCYDRHFSSWKQGIGDYEGRVLFITAEYCEDDRYGQYNDNECRNQGGETTNVIGCYVKGNGSDENEVPVGWMV